MFNFEIISAGKLSQLVREQNIHSAKALIKFIQNMPYGRNANRSDLSLIITENKGTCSSKHAFIKAIAMENGFDDLKLVIGIYKMTAVNTPNIGNGIEINHLEYLPEAHCYLKFKNHTIDVTSENANFEKIKNAILKEIEIEPNQVVSFKVALHQDYIKNWIKAKQIPLRFEEVWAIRENCIANLGN
jgi:hypothetical protein